MNDNNLIVFENEKDLYIKEANALLQEMMGMNCEVVLVVGIKDDKVIMKHSPALDSVKKLGMLEFAKLEFFAQWR